MDLVTEKYSVAGGLDKKTSTIKLRRCSFEAALPRGFIGVNKIEQKNGEKNSKWHRKISELQSKLRNQHLGFKLDCSQNEHRT